MDDLALRYDIDKHVDYVKAMLSDIKNHSCSLKPALDAITYRLSELDFDFSQGFFLQEFARFLWKIDLIQRPTPLDVFTLCDTIIAETGRNYRFVDMLVAFQSTRRAYEVQVRFLQKR